ncbi:Gamma-1-Syntrophin [Manis pentadactyla]|nr:Gamma-1-Syntrophin [Manis pentadactyla]
MFEDARPSVWNTGGAEHNIPVVISKISKEQRVELSGLLFIGDVILQINGINVRKCRHEEVVLGGRSALETLLEKN